MKEEIENLKTLKKEIEIFEAKLIKKGILIYQNYLSTILQDVKDEITVDIEDIQEELLDALKGINNDD